MPRRRNANSYGTYGNVAYVPSYSGGAVRSPKEGAIPQPKVRTHKRRKALTRQRVQVRAMGQIAPFAVVGFFVVGLFAALLLFSYVQYTALSDQLVSLRQQLDTLQTENATLTADYERIFDLERIQSAVGGQMEKPSRDQIEYIDLSEPDSIELYHSHGGSSGIGDVLDGLQDIISEAIAYFR